MTKRLQDTEQLNNDEWGASIVEYALLVALIALVCILAVAFLGGSLSENLSRSASEIGKA